MSQGNAKMTHDQPLWPEGLTDDGVYAYLKSHPDFLLNNQKILSHLKAPGQQGDNATVADFQQAMVERLRKEKQKVLELQRELVTNARDNMSNQSRIHSAILVLLEAYDFEEFIQIITQDFPVLLGVDVCTLILETDGLNIPSLKSDYQGLRLVQTGTVKQELGEEGYGLLLDNMRGSEQIFGPGAGIVRSQALLRLDITPEAPKGILAFGSRDPNMFHEDQGIEQISILAQVIERHVRHFLNLPK